MTSTEKYMLITLLRICDLNHKWANSSNYAKAFLTTVNKQTYPKQLDNRVATDYALKSMLIVKLVTLISRQKHSKMTFSVDIDRKRTNVNGDKYYPLIIYFNYKMVQLSFHVVPYCDEYAVLKKYIGKRRVDSWKEYNGANYFQALWLIGFLGGISKVDGFTKCGDMDITMTASTLGTPRYINNYWTGW